MHTFKDALCLFGIFIAYGIAGHLDFDDAQMLEEAQAPMLLSDSSEDRSLPVALVAPTVPPWSQPARSRAEVEPHLEAEPAAPLRSVHN